MPYLAVSLHAAPPQQSACENTWPPNRPATRALDADIDASNAGGLVSLLTTINPIPLWGGRINIAICCNLRVEEKGLA